MTNTVHPQDPQDPRDLKDFETCRACQRVFKRSQMMPGRTGIQCRACNYAELAPSVVSQYRRDHSRSGDGSGILRGLIYFTLIMTFGLLFMVTSEPSIIIFAVLVIALPTIVYLNYRCDRCGRVSSWDAVPNGDLSEPRRETCLRCGAQREIRRNRSYTQGPLE